MSSRNGSDHHELVCDLKDALKPTPLEQSIIDPAWSDDHELMRDLGDALRPIPVDQSIIDAGRLAFAWQTASADLELAALLYDSHLDQTALVRGPETGPRTLVFGRGSLRVEIELSEARIEGQLIPPEPGIVRLLAAAEVCAETTADEVGCFAFSAPRRAPIRIECALASGRFVTDWVML